MYKRCRSKYSHQFLLDALFLLYHVLDNIERRLNFPDCSHLLVAQVHGIKINQAKSKVLISVDMSCVTPSSCRSMQLLLLGCVWHVEWCVNLMSNITVMACIRRSLVMEIKQVGYYWSPFLALSLMKEVKLKRLRLICIWGWCNCCCQYLSEPKH